MKMKATAPDSAATLHRRSRGPPGRPACPAARTATLHDLAHLARRRPVARHGQPASRRPTVDERYGRACRAVPEVTHDVVLTTPPIAALSARQIQDACGDQPGVLCRRVYESTH